MSKPKMLLRDVDDAFLEDETKPEFKKYKLHKASIVEWLQSRYQKTANIMHLYFPSDLEKHIEIKKIFKKFDEDGSNALQRNEFMDMMEEIMIKVKDEDLKEFYEHVDMDGDDALNFFEFKNCTLSDEANIHYGRMMREARREYEQAKKIREEEQALRELQTKKSLISFPLTSEDIDNYIEASAKKVEEEAGSLSNLNHDSQKKSKDESIDLEEEELKKRKPPIFPSTFGTLMNHLTYRIRRETLRKQIKKQNHENIESAFRSFKELLQLKIEKDTFMNRFNALDKQSEEYQMKKKVLGNMFEYVLPLVDAQEEIKQIRNKKNDKIDEIQQQTVELTQEIKQLGYHEFFKEQHKEELKNYDFIQEPHHIPDNVPKTAPNKLNTMNRTSTSKFTGFRPTKSQAQGKNSSTKSDAFFMTQFEQNKDKNPGDIKRTFNVPVTPVHPNLTIENNNVNLLTGKTRNRVLINIKQNTFRDINSREGSQASLETRDSFRQTGPIDVGTNRYSSIDNGSMKGYYTSIETFKTENDNLHLSHHNSSGVDFSKYKDQFDTSGIKNENTHKTSYPSLTIKDMKTPIDLDNRFAFSKTTTNNMYKTKGQASFGDLRSIKPQTAAGEHIRKKGTKTLAQVLLQPLPETQPGTTKARLEKLDSKLGSSSFTKLPAMSRVFDNIKDSNGGQGYLQSHLHTATSPSSKAYLESTTSPKVANRDSPSKMISFDKADNRKASPSTKTLESSVNRKDSPSRISNKAMGGNRKDSPNKLFIENPSSPKAGGHKESTFGRPFLQSSPNSKALNRNNSQTESLLIQNSTPNNKKKNESPSGKSKSNQNWKFFVFPSGS